MSSQTKRPAVTYGNPEKRTLIPLGDLTDALDLMFPDMSRARLMTLFGEASSKVGDIAFVAFGAPGSSHQSWGWDRDVITDYIRAHDRPEVAMWDELFAYDAAGEPLRLDGQPRKSPVRRTFVRPWSAIELPSTATTKAGEGERS